MKNTVKLLQTFFPFFRSKLIMGKKRIIPTIALLVLFLVLPLFSWCTVPVVDSTKFAQLKAVLIVGHQEDGTKEAIEKMEKIALFLKKKKVTVLSFYDQKADWTKIKEASKGAHFFIYSGHGSTLGENGCAGGLCVNSMISSKTVTEELKLATNAIVIFKSVCRGAGSSAGDDGDIGMKEAEKRVSDYSKPFFKTGAAAYFANNLGSGVENFLKAFFEGKDIHACFEASLGWGTEKELDKAYSNDATKQICIASTDWGGGTVTRTTYTNGVKKVEQIPASKDYSAAYVAHKKFSILDVLKSTASK